MAEKYHVHVSLHQQLLSLFCESRLIKQYPVSTSARGAGNLQESYQTPLGLHQIREKIGGDCQAYEVFIGRQPQGNFYALKDSDKTLPEDVITSRILWLAGLEPGINQGGDVDTYQRYIYIHGTVDEDKIGQPVSHGCIRMLNKDVIELYDQLEVGCHVRIEE